MELLTSSIVAILTHWVWPIFLFIFGLGAVVFVHELGHFLVAKAVGIKVERFAIGFGPRVCGYKGKETDYSIMLLPLGGYVKMLGQEDFEPLKEGQGAPDPRSYSSKSVGARFAVIAAGVTMNVIFAAIMFVIIGMIGMPVPSPVIGGTVPGSPASTAKITWLDDSGEPLAATDPQYPTDQPETLQPGDRMITIDGPGMLTSILGREITRFRRVMMQAVLSDITDKYTLTIKRTVGEKVLHGKVLLSLKMSLSPSGTGSELPSFGIMPASSTILARGRDYMPDKRESYKNDDKIVAINGRKVAHNWEMTKIQKTLLGRRADITVERKVGEKTTQVDIPSVRTILHSTKVFYLKDGEILRGQVVKLDTKAKLLTLLVTEDGVKAPRKVSIGNLTNTLYSEDTGMAKELLDVLGMIPRVQVSGVGEGSPADDAGLEAGDIIVRYGNHIAPTHLKLKELNKEFSADGAELLVLRDGKTLAPLKIKPETRDKDVRIGIIIGSDLEHLMVAGVRKNSPAADLDIRAGDVVMKVNGRDVKTWSDLLVELVELRGEDVTLTMQRGEKSLDKTIPSLHQLIFDESDYTSGVANESWRFRGLMDPKNPRAPLAALAWGGRETTFFVATSYATLRSLINGTVSTKELSGPVGIGSMAIQAGRRSMISFAYFMAIISVSLAVVNFLPFPVVDGGHALFLIIEKIRGKPLSIRIMNAVQMVGLAMILLVFVLVTWQDISRIWGG